ncbi:DNA mismatch repair protein MutS [Sphingomonas sp. Leaf339]|uniref:Smr/MutS family protein n=1 Tax=Sphingomonas sp. Leaf339 TaxID=1736343 RepID=UPI0006F6ED0B|nr:Smr/MutS family protein [Sphingomonas sp. Leaf339]KQU56124.1 DNA mismatch repair protein MutS [Sphingomonas sp. Leaf339]
MATVRPIRVPAAKAPMPVVVAAKPIALPKPIVVPTRKMGRVPPPPVIVPRPSPARTVQNNLDASWDRKLGRGAVIPDSSIDLHGHTLSSAHAMLDAGIERAIRRGDRVLLLVTGKPPRPESERPHARGAIRAAVADWLAGSRHADAIAAVRGAHPRHGGMGALYIVLRRPRVG